MVELEIPTDKELLASVGRVAIRHGQLDHVLKMTIKSIERISVREAMDATNRQGSRELRDRVKKLAKAKIGDGQAFLRLEALLDRCRRAADDRNEILHTLWAQNEQGDLVIRDDDPSTFRDAPTSEELNELADELAALATELNDARLKGFIRDALAKCR